MESHSAVSSCAIVGKLHDLLRQCCRVKGLLVASGVARVAGPSPSERVACVSCLLSAAFERLMALSSFALRCRALPAQGWRQRASVSLEPGRLRFGPALRSDAARLAHAGARGVAAAYQPSDASPGTDASAQAQNSGLSTLELFQEVRRRHARTRCHTQALACSLRSDPGGRSRPS